MPTQTLKNSLARLREELEEPTELDAETRQQLAEVADTIEHVLNEPKADFRQAYTHIEDVALGFEARHPAFSRLLSDVTDAIAKLGI
jgi:hypothetical protein